MALTMSRFRILATFLVLVSLLVGCSGLKSGSPGTTGGVPVTGTPGDAPESDPEPEQKPEPPPPPPKPIDKANDVRGIYLTGWSAGSQQKMESTIAFMKEHGLNAVVIDAKDDDGLVTWQSDIALAKEIGANSDKIGDIAGLLKLLQDNDIYTIARIVVFIDPVLADHRPEWAILNGEYRDSRGLKWTNPYDERVWEYNVEVAKAAAAVGFNEIQFDYVRFPEKHLPGVNIDVPMEQRTGAINNFLKYAKQELEPYNVFLSADVFGLTTSVTDDMTIGQDYAQITEIVDYVSAMIYPSHYGAGNYGLADPNAAPRETVYNSMVKGRHKTMNEPVTKHRPWLQDFDLGLHYGIAEVEAQLRGIAEAGIRSFMLWDPSNVYTSGVNFSIIDTTEALPLPEPEKVVHPDVPVGPDENEDPANEAADNNVN